MKAQALNYRAGLTRIWIILSAAWVVGVLASGFPEISYWYRYHFEFEAAVSDAKAVNKAAISLVTEDVERISAQLIEKQKSYDMLFSILGSADLKPSRDGINKLVQEIEVLKARVDSLKTKSIEPLQPSHSVFVRAFAPPAIVYAVATVALVIFKWIVRGFFGARKNG